MKNIYENGIRSRLITTVNLGAATLSGGTTLDFLPFAAINLDEVKKNNFLTSIVKWSSITKKKYKYFLKYETNTIRIQFFF